MSEPKRYNADLNIPCGISPTTAAEVYLCDDPAIVEWKRKAEELDKLEENARSLDLPTDEEIEKELRKYVMSSLGNVIPFHSALSVAKWLRSRIEKGK